MAAFETAHALLAALALMALRKCVPPEALALMAAVLYSPLSALMA